MQHNYSNPSKLWGKQESVTDGQRYY